MFYFLGSGFPVSGIAAFLTLVIPWFIRIYFQSPNRHESSKASPQNRIQFHTMLLEISDNITLRIADDERNLRAQLCTFVSHIGDMEINCDEEQLCLIIDGYITLTIKHSLNCSVHSYQISWESSPLMPWHCDTLEDLFEMLDSHWFGLGHVFCHYWPMEKWDTAMAPLVTGESGPLSFTSWMYYGGIQERLLLNSAGVGIFVDEDVPLFLSINNNSDGSLKLRSVFRSPYTNTEKRPPFMNYHICHATDIKELWCHMQRMFLQKPRTIPDEGTFTNPVWSTWAEFKCDVNQEKVLQLAEDIAYYDFPCSHIEIDDDWTPHYGCPDVNSRKFPDMKQLVQTVKQNGYKVSLWTHPYVSFLSKTFFTYWKDGLLVKGQFGFPEIFSWWNGYAGLIDFTNNEAKERYKKSLQLLKDKYGISSFKFDAGEGAQLSTRSKLYKPLKSPNDFSHIFAESAYSSDTTCLMQEVRVAYRNQSLPMWFRLQDKDSNWGYLNGLRTVIPHVLTLGLLGYPFVLPDMIGGNAYTGRPDRELYIRWVQLSALMPALQFSLVPWKFDPEVIVIARRMCKLHVQYTTKIVELAKEATVSGAPVIRPLWWIAPLDEVALTIDDEFLVGDDILVAPVLQKGARSRDVYLPSGSWKDEISQERITGGKWMENYYTGLVDLPHFTRVK